VKIETAPVEWLRAVVEAVCSTLEINPAMLPTDPHLAGEKVAGAVSEAREESSGDDYDLPLGATEADGIPARKAPTNHQLDAMQGMLQRLNAAASDARQASVAALEAADAIEDEILEITNAMKAKENPK
jgi:hypothetical protein